MDRKPEAVNPYREPVHISVILAELLIELEQDSA